MVRGRIRRLGVAGVITVLACGCAAQHGERHTTTSRSEAAPGPAGEPHYGAAVPRLGSGSLSPAVTGKTVLVVGDSWSASIGQGMSEVGASRNTVVNAGLGGCGILLPVGKETPEACRKWPTRWPSYLQKYKPDAILLTVGFWDVTPQRLAGDKEAHDLTSPAHETAFRDRLNQAISLLTERNTPLYLMTSQQAGHPKYRSSALVMNRVLREASAKHPGVRLLDLRGQLCNDDGCPQVLAGTQVYDPTEHPTKPARARLANWALNAMFTKDGA
ncbi:DUF459 domain-containing protein [Streptomyces nodosus]|uniref:DUF459 domain-containing protein n=1 Tax=Streptomyces nodosus TaxID=40318 RepID=A0A5P2W3K6_9ACTN|nr:SGNH hydrolase domain-containing protein [Streptomyces nodosus]MBB4790826.1 hypothetical protein [Streptomyces nodosus]QEV38433.1 DUF459 domain-containing protein [Streptomyces nodosus]